FFTDYERKLEDVRHLLIESRNKDEDPIGSLIFVDAIQRLGIGHHYQDEIQAILKQHYVKTSHRIYGCCSLHDIALSFRLLRQRGYHVSADVFNNFKGEDGKFKGELKQDIKGLLELYEATQVSFEGENILDEAEEFSKQQVYERLEANLDDHEWSNIVRMRLRHPVQKSITRVTGRKNFLNHDLRGINGCGKLLGELSNMDLLVGRSIYKDELLQVSKWWNGLGLTEELKLARNQPIKWYTWSMAILIDDISLSEQRVQLSQSIAFIYLIDDIFDLYGTLDELAIFTEAVDKWDHASMDMLPIYMKTCYKALLDTTNEIGLTISEKYGYNPINTLKQTWTSLCRAFLVEAKWFASGDLPKAEDYLANGKVSSGVHVVLVHLFYLLGLGPAYEGAIHLDDTSTLVSCVAAILRLWDDLGSAEDEHQNGNDGSYMECYMKDHKDSTYKQVREHMMDMIASEWKHLNKECFHLNHLSFQEASLNLARMVPLMYGYDDKQRLPILEEFVNFLLLNPTSLDLRHTEEQKQVNV
ncbi:tricyclene synthase oc15 chloroplastic, partial [Phtheirospermum japonicum]